jgi:hypothetical protein
MLSTLMKYAVALAAYAGGIIANSVMLREFPVQSMALRWIIAFTFGYLIFLLAVRFYCFATAPRARRLSGDSGSWWDNIDLTSGWSSSGTGPGPIFRGGGGSFGGAGSSGSFDAPAVHGGSSFIPDVDLDLGGDDGVLVVVAIAAIACLALGLGGSLLYVLWHMPGLLADAAAGAAIVGIAGRRHQEGWIAAVLRHTWKPAIASVVSLAAVGIALHHFFPGARTLGEVLMVL